MQFSLVRWQFTAVNIEPRSLDFNCREMISVIFKGVHNMNVNYYWQTSVIGQCLTKKSLTLTLGKKILLTFLYFLCLSKMFIKCISKTCIIFWHKMVSQAVPILHCWYCLKNSHFEWSLVLFIFSYNQFCTWHRSFYKQVICFIIVDVGLRQLNQKKCICGRNVNFYAPLVVQCIW